MIDTHAAAIDKIAKDLNIPEADVRKTINFLFSYTMRSEMVARTKRILVRGFGEFVWSSKRREIEKMAQRARKTLYEEANRAGDKYRARKRKESLVP